MDIIKQRVHTCPDKITNNKTERNAILIQSKSCSGKQEHLQNVSFATWRSQIAAR